MHATKFYRPARSYPPVLPVDDVVIKAPPVLQQNRTTGVSGLLQYALPALGGWARCSLSLSTATISSL